MNLRPLAAVAALALLVAPPVRAEIRHEPGKASALYEAYHAIVPVRLAAAADPTEEVDVVGPVCESGDFLALGRTMPVTQPGDVLAVLSAGAYGMSMAGTYNTRPLAAEVLVHGETVDVIRPRQTLSELLASERMPSWLERP